MRFDAFESGGALEYLHESWTHVACRFFFHPMLFAPYRVRYVKHTSTLFRRYCSRMSYESLNK
jgi:hypothetical protein